MNEEKTLWNWGEDVKQTLDRIYETAKNADSATKTYLKSQVTRLLQEKAESAKHNIIGNLIGLISMAPFLLKPESKTAALLAKGVGDSISEEKIRTAQLDKIKEEIMNSIPSMSTGQLRQLARLLMSDKTIPVIQSSLKYVNERF